MPALKPPIDLLRCERNPRLAHATHRRLLGNPKERPRLRRRLQPRHGFRQPIRADELNGFRTAPDILDPSKRNAPASLPISAPTRLAS